MDCDNKLDEHDVFFSQCHWHTWKNNLSSLNRGQTYDFPVTCSNNDCNFFLSIPVSLTE